MFENLDFGNGEIIYNDIAFDINERLENIDLAYLEEDLFRVVYSNNYEIDLGWYGLKDNGSFRIIVHYFLENTEPVFLKNFKEPNEIEKYISEAINKVKSI